MTFLSDFGLADEYVAVCKAVIRSIAAEADVFDLTHLIRPFGVREGAAVLSESVGWFPRAVHLAVVDPGVGSDRKAIVVSAGDALFVGPDNGLLLAAADRVGGVAGAWQITNRDLGLPGRSSTFHGRDVFAPAAAHLAGGAPPEVFGPPLEVVSLVRLPEPAVIEADGGYLGEIVLVDRFGNLQTSLTRRHVESLGLRAGNRAQVEVGNRTLGAVLRESYSYGSTGELQLIEDSHGSMALCVNLGSAAALLGHPALGSQILLKRPPARQ
ncbi:MAG TPA: SAM-dependent chlorinase/fluorinase [Actinomycetota bacterium]|nr:SAM-dependent chlorinase/fluorinase [Actinomycetota bacterium]